MTDKDALTPAQPVWRIERNDRNIRLGDFIIDRDGDSGTVTHQIGWGRWGTDGTAFTNVNFAPYIVFPSRESATPEAIEEAIRARTKEDE